MEVQCWVCVYCMCLPLFLLKVSMNSNKPTDGELSRVPAFQELREPALLPFVWSEFYLLSVESASEISWRIFATMSSTNGNLKVPKTAGELVCCDSSSLHRLTESEFSICTLRIEWFCRPGPSQQRLLDNICQLHFGTKWNISTVGHVHPQGTSPCLWLSLHLHRVHICDFRWNVSSCWIV